MEGNNSSNIEREYGALGGLFQQIIQDMKVSKEGRGRTDMGIILNKRPKAIKCGQVIM